MPKKDTVYFQLKQLGILTTVPFILLAGPLVGFGLGTWIDRKAGSEPWGMVAMITLGFVASAREVIRLIRRISKDTDLPRR